MAELNTGLAAILRRHEARLLADWMSELAKAGRSGAIDKAELEEQARTFVRLLTEAAQADAGARTSGLRLGAAQGDAGDAVGLTRAPGLHADGDGDLCLLVQAAAVRGPSRGVQARRRGSRARDVGRHDAPRQAGPLHRRDLPEEPRGGDHAPAAGSARAVDPRGRALGRNPGAAPHRHARQRAHAGGDGEPARADRRDRRVHRHHRHHGCAHRGHPGRAAPAQDRRRRAAHGRRVHHQRHPAADRPDHRPSRRRPGGRRDQGDPGLGTGGGARAPAAPASSARRPVADDSAAGDRIPILKMGSSCS